MFYTSCNHSYPVAGCLLAVIWRVMTNTPPLFTVAFMLQHCGKNVLIIHNTLHHLLYDRTGKCCESFMPSSTE